MKTLTAFEAFNKKPETFQIGFLLKDESMIEEFCQDFGLGATGVEVIKKPANCFGSMPKILALTFPVPTKGEVISALKETDITWFLLD